MSLKDTTFGSYTIVRQLSMGETSEVYLARRGGFAGFERQVVIKCVPEHLSQDTKFVEQFREEARLVARLSHPNIVPVHEFGQEGDTHYLMMEYIPGITLEEAIAKTFGVEPSHAFRITSEMCSGLAYAHAFKNESEDGGVVHRNVNPQNVLLGFDGSVKLIDFGIAKAAAVSNETRTALFKGRYGYLAPEQAQGEHVDHRADIHAVAVVLWEMLMGFPLYDRGNAVDTVEAVLHQKPSPVKRRHPDLPAKVDEVLSKALAKDPGDRYQSCVELQEDIEELVAESGRLSTSTALGQFVRTCAETVGPGGAAPQATGEGAFTTARTSIERPRRSSDEEIKTKREGTSSDDADTSEIVAPTKRRPVTPLYNQTPAVPPPTLRVAPPSELGAGQDAEEHERLDPTIPMPWKHAPSSGINVHLARLEELAAAQEAANGQAPPSQSKGPVTGEHEHRGSTALWIISSVFGIALVTAGTFFVLRSDLLEAWTGWSIHPRPSASTQVDASPGGKAVRVPDAAAAKVTPPPPIKAAPVDRPPVAPRADAGEPNDELPTAFLSIRSDPSGAQLFIDSYPTREWTNFHDLPIDPGEHTIELALLGYRRWTQTMVVERGQRVVLRAHLHVRPEGEEEPPSDAGLPDFGILSVDTTPPSLVYLGRKSLGQTPVSDVELPSGEHRLTFVLEKGERVRRTVRVLSGRTTRLNINLEKSPTKRSSHPTKQDHEPSKQGETPTKQSGAPTKQDGAPTKQDGAPAKQGLPPTKQNSAQSEGQTKRPAPPPEKRPSKASAGGTKTEESAP